ncbi:MAG: hypothetical protein JWM78_3042 [Verrucomicrobiaceae bacterium]|nr:hypothetical protein [Verrucomicrobiaceae bacterium]
MTSTQHLNPDVLQELRMVMGTEFTTLLRTFDLDSEQRIAAIAAALEGVDANALRRAAHSFKGSAGNMGATRVSDLCRQLEELGRNETIAGADVLLQQLRAEFAQVQREINDIKA